MSATKTLIAMPCMETMPTRTVSSLLSMERPGKTAISFTIGSLVYEARNEQASVAINQGYDRVLWIDSDMRFDTDLMVRLAGDVDAGCDFVCGLFFKRQLPLTPLVYKALDFTETDEDISVNVTMYEPDTVPRDKLFRIGGSGFGACMVTTRMLKDIWERSGPPFTPLSKLGEDLSFCLRAKQAGYEMWCDSRVKIGHLGYIEYGARMMPGGGTACS